MKKNLLLIISLLISTFSFSQTDRLWSPNATKKENIVKDKGVARLTFPKEFKLYNLNNAIVRNDLFSVVGNKLSHSTVISLPNADGGIEQFEVYEASNFEPDLQAKFPEIRAFSGKGITDKYATLKLSISPQGMQTMVFRTDKENEFIEPYSLDHTIYAVFKSNRQKGKLAWTCSTDEQNMVAEVSAKAPNVTTLSNAGQLKTMRLAQSCNGEYANYFGATSAAQVGLVLAAYNNTLTRCNGVYEKDLALHLNLVASSTNVIYYTPSTDPYSTLANWNTELQIALNTTLTGPSTTLANNNLAYDIGHMFGASGGGGNAGCIGCVCVDGIAAGTGSTKGRGITSPADGVPQGDNFDIDYVVHEVGHQLGGNHTFSHNNEGSGVNKEVGSGITIMGYAGITAQDVAPHSIDIFHEASITQIQTNLNGKTCPITTSLSGTNATPVVAAVASYTIPKSTPFVLTGSATDANPGDALTYCWEQNDNTTTSGANSIASPTKTTGPNFLSWSPTASPSRYFPKLSSTIANSLTTAAVGVNDANILTEAISSVARTLNFRLTVRDNSPYSSTAPIKVGQTQFTDMVVTVNGTAGPFLVTAPNTAVSWIAGTTQTVTWNVAGTTTNGVNCANVDIFLSTDGGLTYPITLLTATTNDGTQSITVPNNIGTTNRIMIKGSNHIFFDISNTNFTIGPDTVAPTAPTLTASNTTSNSTDLSWSGATDNVGVTSYEVYKNSVFLGTTSVTTYPVTGLTPSTAYSFTVKAKDAVGNLSVNSNTVNITTLGGTTAVTTKLYIQGFYTTSIHSMRPVKANQGVGTSATNVDDITLELRNTTTPYGLIATTTAVLQTNGIATGSFNTVISGSYYLVIKHRNALQTWSATPIAVSASTPTYDFTNAVTKAYGSNMILVEPGVWAFYSGDINQDGNIDTIDYPILELDSNNFASGNYTTDLNGDGNVDTIDFPILELNTNNFISVAKP